MSTPTPPEPSVINWYYGPTSWDQDPARLWHAKCPDPYATGHDGEVWLDTEGGAFCTGCRQYEPGQAQVMAAAEQLVNATGAPPLLAPEAEDYLDQTAPAWTAGSGDVPSDVPAAADVPADQPVDGSTNPTADEAPVVPDAVQDPAEAPSYLQRVGRDVRQLARDMAGAEPETPAS